MGATFCSKTLPGDLTATQVREQFDLIVSQCKHQHGNDPYNGTFSTCRGIEVVPGKTVYPTVEAAEDWLDRNTEKWGLAKAVRAKDIRTVAASKPTFPVKKVKGPHDYGWHDEVLGWEIRGVCIRNDKYVKDLVCETIHTLQSFRYRTDGVWECVPANEMKDADECRRLFGVWYDLMKAYNTNVRGMNELVAVLQGKLLVPFDDYDRLKAYRTAARLLLPAVMEAWAALVKFDVEQGKLLNTSRQEDHGVVWVIGGTVAL